MKKSLFVCQECGCTSPGWQGKCPECNQWNTFEEVAQERAKSKQKTSSPVRARPINEIEFTPDEIFPTTIRELDRVLGSGVVKGAAILLGGEPGIGKSTLALQAAQKLAENGQKVLYITAEESEQQISLRSQRTGTNPDTLFVLARYDVDDICDVIRNESPELVILDSIQAISDPNIPSVTGTANQVRQCAAKVIHTIKDVNCGAIIIGHITKEGGLAGPKVLEHMVDVILYVEGERSQQFRLLRCLKNRFSNTDEVGIFEMNETGLSEVLHPSGMFIDLDQLSAGSMVVATLEGSRSLLVELQALAVESGYGMAKRSFLGVDPNRAAFMVAVAEKKLSLKLFSKDIFVSVIGGMKVKEPAMDLAMILAVISSIDNTPIKNGIGVLGEVGLTGELRPVTHLNKRLREYENMGFHTCVLPEKNKKQFPKSIKITPIYVRNIEEALSTFHARLRTMPETVVSSPH